MDSEELIVKQTKPPTYISTLLNSSEDIILVYKGTKEIKNESFASCTSEKRKSDDTLLDVTGSPLQVNFDNSSLLRTSIFEMDCNLWTTEEESHYPISRQYATQYISGYVRKNRSKSVKPQNIWCVCDAQDEEKTVLMSAVQTPDNITRSFGTVCGYLPKDHPAISFEAFCNRHLNDVARITDEKEKVPLRQLQSNILSTYEILGSKSASRNFDTSTEIKGNVTVDVAWNLCCAEIPPDNAESTMIIQTVIGQPCSPIFCVWKELILLELYMKALSEYNSETLHNNDWLPSSAVVHDKFKLIQCVIDTVASCDQPRYENQPEQADLQQTIDGMCDRNSYDLTDRLWTVLTQCTTYGALSDCLNVAFTEVANCETDIYVAAGNGTSMAHMMRGMKAGKIAVPMLKGTQPIEMLIDIGLEKIRKDFAYIFIHANIMGMHELNELFFNSEQSSDSRTHGRKSIMPDIKNRKSFMPEMSKQKLRATLYHNKPVIDFTNIEKRIKLLGQLYTVLEILILVPDDWLKFSASAVIDHFIGEDSPIDSFGTLARNKFHEMRVDLPINLVYNLIVGLSPSMWRFSLTTSRPLYAIQSVFHLSQRCLFPPSICKLNLAEETLMDPGDLYYYCTTLTQITDFIKSRLSCYE